MMRSDMPKQIMAYRNGGGLPSLATAPGNFSTGGGIGSFVSNAYNKAVDVVKDALGFNNKAQLGSDTMGITSSGSLSDAVTGSSPNAGKTSQQRLSDLKTASDRRKKRRKKRRARQAAAEAAAAAAAAAEQEAANVESGIMSLDPDIMNSAITNMVNERDDLSAVQKLEFAQSLADSYGVSGGTGVQSAIDNLSNIALDPTSGLSDTERVSALTSLGTATGTDYSGLISTLNNQINETNLGSSSPGEDLIDNLGSSNPGDNLGSVTNSTYNPISVPDPVSYATYNPIVPATNILPSGIMGLPSSNYTFSSYMPETFTPAVNSLVLPPLG
jgi:hypothetical protein